MPPSWESRACPTACPFPWRQPRPDIRRPLGVRRRPGRVRCARGPRSTLFLSPSGKPFHADAGKPYPVADWFAEADANQDGKLTKDEFRADFAKFFSDLDQNHNGAIDGVELQRYEQQVAPEVLPRLAQVQGGFPGERRGSGERRLAEAPRGRNGVIYDGAPAYSLFNVSEPVASADADFDGKVTLEEFLRMADRRFDCWTRTRPAT